MPVPGLSIFLLCLKLIVMNKRILLLITVLGFLISSCAIDPVSKYIDGFGEFINNIELNADQYNDDEWDIVTAEFNQLSVIQYNNMKTELSETEKDQIESFRKRFKKVEIKRDPSGNILKVFGL